MTLAGRISAMLTAASVYILESPSGSPYLPPFCSSCFSGPPSLPFEDLQTDLFS